MQKTKQNSFLLDWHQSSFFNDPQALTSHVKNTTNLVFNSSLNSLVTYSDSNLHVYSLEKNDLSHEFNTGNTDITSIFSDPNSATIITANTENVINFTDLEQKTASSIFKPKKFSTTNTVITHISGNLAKKRLVIGFDNGVVKLLTGKDLNVDQRVCVLPDIIDIQLVDSYLVVLTKKNIKHYNLKTKPIKSLTLDNRGTDDSRTTCLSSKSMQMHVARKEAVYLFNAKNCERGACYAFPGDDKSNIQVVNDQYISIASNQTRLSIYWPLKCRKMIVGNYVFETEIARLFCTPRSLIVVEITGKISLLKLKPLQIRLDLLINQENPVFDAAVQLCSEEKNTENLLYRLRLSYAETLFKESRVDEGIKQLSECIKLGKIPPISVIQPIIEEKHFTIQVLKFLDNCLENAGLLTLVDKRLLIMLKMTCLIRLKDDVNLKELVTLRSN